MPGGLDGLVLNVGIGLGEGLSRTTPEQWDQTFAVNVQIALPVLPGGARAALGVRGEGASSAVVFVSSVAAD